MPSGQIIRVDQREPNNPIGRFVPPVAWRLAQRAYGPSRNPGPDYGTGPVNLRATLMGQAP